MARIRTIKPDFFESESLAQCSMEARLVFIGLFTIADDEGRLKDLPRKLAGEVFPHDDISPEQMSVWLDELENAHCIARYTHENAHFLHIPHWNAHQKIAHPTPSRLPAPPDECEPIPEILGEIPQASEKLSIGSRNKEVGNRNAHRKGVRVYDEKFDEVWEHYPRKKSKAYALKAYTARRREGISHDDLLTATKNYAAYVKSRHTDPEYVLWGATFFGPNERWKDYLEAEQMPGQQPSSWGVAKPEDTAPQGPLVIPELIRR